MRSSRTYRESTITAMEVNSFLKGIVFNEGHLNTYREVWKARLEKCWCSKESMCTLLQYYISMYMYAQFQNYTTQVRNCESFLKPCNHFAQFQNGSRNLDPKILDVASLILNTKH